MQQIKFAEIKQIKTGVSAQGKEWQLFSVVSDDGKKYSCFGSTLSVANAKQGEEYMCEVVTTKNGKFTNNTIKSISKPLTSVVAPNLGSVAGLEGNKSQLDRIEGKIDELLNRTKLPF